MNQTHASVCIDLPTDEDEEAQTKLTFGPIWKGFLEALTAAKISYVAKRETIPTRAKPARTGAKPGRKPRQLPAELTRFPQQPLANSDDNPPEAA